MATQGPTQNPAFLSGDADFRLFASNIHNALIALGLVQTADTGQINLATVVRPAVNGFGGYVVYRFNDTQQANLPIFIKMEFGVGSVVDRPALAVTVGTGSNGAGAITGMVTARYLIRPNASKTAGVTLPMYVSAADGRLALVANVDFTSTNFFIGFIVERTKDAAGVVTADGAFVWRGSVLDGDGWYVIPGPNSGAQVILPERGNFPAVDPGWGRSNSSGDLALAPGMIFLGKAFYLATVTHGGSTDFTGGAAFTAAHLGATRTFMSLTGAVRAADSTIGAVAGVLAIPWE